MKKILILNGSPRMNGNTSALIEEFSKGAKDKGHDVIRFDLDSDNSFRMYYAIVDAEGVVGEEHGLITRFIKGMADLTNGGVIIIRPNVLSDYDGLTLDSVKLRVAENGQMLLSLTDVVVDGINFTFTDVVLSTETEA